MRGTTAPGARQSKPKTKTADGSCAHLLIVSPTRVRTKYPPEFYPLRTPKFPPRSRLKQNLQRVTLSVYVLSFFSSVRSNPLGHFFVHLSTASRARSVFGPRTVRYYFFVITRIAGRSENGRKTKRNATAHPKREGLIIAIDPNRGRRFSAESSAPRCLRSCRVIIKNHLRSGNNTICK